MGALTLGLIAALSWGVHDTCIRYVSQNVGIFPSLFPVLVTGAVITSIMGLVSGAGAVPWQITLFAMLSGIAFGLTGISFFKALSIGPVRVVAPVVASYPILSVGWAVFNGQSITVLQWLAVITIVGGVGFVALSADRNGRATSNARAVLWSIVSAFGFATAFALGQMSVAEGGEIASIAIARLAAVAAVGLVAVAARAPVMPARSQLPVLVVMGLLDTIAMGAVMLAGTRAHPEFASVAASTFGILTIILAAIFLKEAVSRVQWAGVITVFAAIGYLAL